MGNTRLVIYKCPVCDGAGYLSRPSWLPGDVRTWTSHATSYPCRRCEGLGTITVEYAATPTGSEGA